MTECKHGNDPECCSACSWESIVKQMDLRIPLAISPRVHDLFVRLMRVYGPDAQISQTQEELAELIVDLSHVRRGRKDLPEAAEEIADVIIMVSQLARLLPPGLLHDKIERKLSHLAMKHMKEDV